MIDSIYLPVFPLPTSTSFSFHNILQNCLCDVTRSTLFLSVDLLTMVRTSSGITVKILKFGTPQAIAIIVLKIEKFDVTLHQCIQKMLMEWQTA